MVEAEVLITASDSKFKKTFYNRKFNDEYKIKEKVGLGPNGHVFDIYELKDPSIDILI